MIFVALYAGFRPGLLAVGLSALAASFWIGPDGKPALFSAIEMITIMLFLLVALLIVCVWGFARMRRLTRREAETEASQQKAEATGVGQKTVIAGQKAVIAGQKAVIAGQKTTIEGQETTIEGQETTIAGQETTLAEQETALTGQAGVLRVAEQRLALALESGRIGVWDLDVLGQSPQNAMIIGFESPCSKWDYETFLAHVMEDDRAEVMEKIRRAVEMGEDWDFECRIRGTDEQIRWVWLRGKHLAAALPRLLGLVEDITERKRAEKLLKESLEIAEIASRAKDRFLAILSHELRTPLTPALIAISVHETDVTLPSELREDLGMIRRNLELEVRLIDDLLDLNRITRGKIELHLQASDLHLILRNVVEICRGKIEAKGLTFSLELTAAEHNVNGDGGRLQQVFWNLLGNAIKFTPTGGAITIRSSNPRDGVVQVAVADTGRGIPPQIIAGLFVAFEQGESAITQPSGGMGLGLAISKAVVDLHDGKIWGNSEGPGKGATFTVELPLSRTEVSTEERPRPAAFATDWKSRIGERKLRILLVEDNMDTLQILSRLLERKGCSVTAAKSVGEALAAAQAAREGAEKFDVVVSDLGLPDGDGRELMRQLRDRDGLSGIAISGYGMEEDIEKSLHAGFAKHLTKPIQLKELQSALSDLVSQLPNRASEE